MNCTDANTIAFSQAAASVTQCEAHNAVVQILSNGTAKLPTCNPNELRQGNEHHRRLLKKRMLRKQQREQTATIDVADFQARFDHLHMVADDVTMPIPMSRSVEEVFRQRALPSSALRRLEQATKAIADACSGTPTVQTVLSADGKCHETFDKKNYYTLQYAASKYTYQTYPLSDTSCSTTPVQVWSPPLNTCVDTGTGAHVEIKLDNGKMGGNLSMSIYAGGSPGKCSGRPLTVIPYLADGNCHANPSAKMSYKMTYNAPAKELVLSQYAESDTTCTGAHKDSPLPLMTCFPVSSLYDIEFTINATTKVALEIVWKVPLDIDHCEWKATGGPFPVPPQNKQLLRQIYNSSDCDPASVVVQSQPNAAQNAGSGWVAQQLDMCLKVPQLPANASYYAVGCKGVTATVSFGCAEHCTPCAVTQQAKLGECVPAPNLPGGSMRFILVGPSSTC
jgi:hypothetical protein